MFIKNIFLVFFLIFCVGFTAIFIAYENKYSPANTALVFDLDDVLLDKEPGFTLKIALPGIAKGHLADLKWLQRRYLQLHGERVFFNSSGQKVSGITFQMLYAGLERPSIASFIPKLVKKTNKNRMFIPGTKRIIKYLKYVKGYNIYYATNKDRISYDDVAEKIGRKLTLLPEKVFVFQPANTNAVMLCLQKERDNFSLPVDYRKLLSRVLDVKPTNKIIHCSVQKPYQEYFDILRTHILHPNIVFVDDKMQNILGAQKISSIRGIVFQDPVKLAQSLIDLGILDKNQDRKFLEKIGYFGFKGKVK